MPHFADSAQVHALHTGQPLHARAAQQTHKRTLFHKLKNQVGPWLRQQWASEQQHQQHGG